MYHHVSDTFRIWCQDEISAAAAARSNTLQALKRDCDSAFEVPFSGEDIMMWSQADCAAAVAVADGDLAAEWSQCLTKLKVWPPLLMCAVPRLVLSSTERRSRLT